MRLSRPVAAVLLLAGVLLLAWLSLGQGGGGQERAGTPGPTARAPSPPPAGADEPRGVDTRDWDDVDACGDDELPAQLDEVADDVEAGGPFDHPGRDGSTFANYEGYLPDESRGYYREYTVPTPGLDHRGARRIVAGGGATDPEVWYYTEDHYESFCVFAP